MLRKPDSLSPKDIRIEDKAMEPFFITKQLGAGYTIYERVQSEGKKEYIRSVSYPASFQGAIKRIAQELLEQKGTKLYSNLNSYIEAYDKITDNLKNSISERV